ncbi:hypothetical protein D3C72_2276830 [compost metagenome]
MPCDQSVDCSRELLYPAADRPHEFVRSHPPERIAALLLDQTKRGALEAQFHGPVPRGGEDDGLI